MTPNRKSNKHCSPGCNAGVIKTNSTSCYIQSNLQQQHDQINRNIQELISVENHPHPNHSPNTTQQILRKDHFSNRNEPEFIPLFVLVEACRENNERKIREITRKLCNLDAEEAEPVVNFQDQAGRTALSYACGCGNINIIDEICKFKFTNPNLADNDGNAPLHYSSVTGHVEGISFLVSRFHAVVDVNVRNTSGLTPLMKAALQGRTRCAKSLLAAGASPMLRDYTREMTAGEWAKLCGRHMCAEIINRSAERHEMQTSSSLIFSRERGYLPNHRSNGNEEDHSFIDETPYYHMHARSTVSGAKWLKNKIKKILGASVRSGDDKSYVYDNPAVRSLAEKRPPSERHYTTVSHLGLGGATICASSLLLPKMQSDQKRHGSSNVKMLIPQVHITPVRR